MRKVSMKKISEVLRLHFKLGLSLRQSARASNISRSTASDYFRRFTITSTQIDQFLLLDEHSQQELLFPETVAPTKRLRTLPDMLTIHNELKNAKKSKVTLMLLWQEYKDSNPDGYSYSQFREHYKRYVGILNPSMRQVYLPGDKLFVDYSGLTMPIVNSTTGEITNAQIFVAVLGASGYTFVHASPSQQKQDFIYSHVLAFEFFGGTPTILVPDNLKSAITSHTKQGVVVNESYASLARFYNCAVEPARPYKPKDKAKVEAGVRAIQRWIMARLRHQKFFSVDELNCALSPLLDAYNNKIVKRMNKSRTQMYSELDLPYLSKLPVNRYVHKELKIATVNQNYHVMLDSNEYSVPYTHLKDRVEIRYSSRTVEIYHGNKLIATHPKLIRRGEVSTLSEHMPKNHQYQYEKMNPERLLDWSLSIGSCTARFVEMQMQSVEHPPNAYRKIIAVLSLAKIYGKSEVELAIAYAMTHNLSTTASIKSVCEKKLYLTNNPANNVVSPTSILNAHENIRGKSYYK